MKYSRYSLKIDCDHGKVILYNLLTGALDILENYQEDISYKKDELRFLLDRGHIIRSEKEERAKENELIKKLEEKEKKENWSFVLVLSYLCNFKCYYCYEANLSNDTKVISENAVDNIFSLLDEYEKEGKKVDKIVITGGEPLLEKNRDILKYILRKIKNRNLKYEIITNGYNLDAFLEMIKSPRLSSVQITIDGTEKVHDKRRIHKAKKKSFKKIIRNIDFCLQERIDVDLRINVDNNNVSSIGELAAFFREKNYYDSNHFIPYLYPLSDNNIMDSIDETELLNNIIRQAEDAPDLLKIDWRFHGIDHLKSIRDNTLMLPMFKFCCALKSQLLFDPHGDIYTCWFIAGHKEYSIGKYDPVIEIDDSKLGLWHNRSIRTIKKCKNCIYKFVCGTGCVMKTLSNNNYSTIVERCSDFPNLISNTAKFFFNI